MQEVLIEPWLPFVEKPSRYIDHELNAVRKAWRDEFCFVYPDVYEVGVSHLGLKILYSIVNRLDGVMADRAYLPWLDMIDIMRRERLPSSASKAAARCGISTSWASPCKPNSPIQTSPKRCPFQIFPC